MATLDNILNLLNEWPAWKRITEAPEKVEKLEELVAELDKNLERAPGEACPACGALEFRTADAKPDMQWGDVGGIRRTFRCGECGHEEKHLETPS